MRNIDRRGNTWLTLWLLCIVAIIALQVARGWERVEKRARDYHNGVRP